MDESNLDVSGGNVWEEGGDLARKLVADGLIDVATVAVDHDASRGEVVGVGVVVEEVVFVFHVEVASPTVVAEHVEGCDSAFVVQVAGRELEWHALGGNCGGGTEGFDRVGGVLEVQGGADAPGKGEARRAGCYHRPSRAGGTFGGFPVYEGNGLVAGHRMRVHGARIWDWKGFVWDWRWGVGCRVRDGRVREASGVSRS